MMMIYYVLTLFWSNHDGKHMIAEKLTHLLRRPRLQAFAFVLYLTHIHRDLCWMELFD